MPVCDRCGKTVYFNEEKRAVGKSYHTSCFVCANSACKRRLDTGSLTEHNEEIYCKLCYSRCFGPKGYGYGGGSGTLSMFTENATNCNGNNQTPSTSTIVNVTVQASSVAPQSMNKENASSQVKIPITMPKSKIIYGSRDICARCNKAVYMAERMMGGGSAWHKSCFNCIECHKRLESTTLCEREGELYCKSCYARLHGPKYYGHGQVAAPIENTMK